MAEVDTFAFGRPNTLLSPKINDVTVVSSGVDTFFMTGLLGGNVQERSAETDKSEEIVQRMEVDGSDADGNFQEAIQSFVPTGLLSVGIDSVLGSGTAPESTINENLITQEPELPDVTELLRPYKPPAAGGNTSSEAGPSNPTYFVRASNFDGNTVLLKRKPPRRAVSSATQTLLNGATTSEQRFGKLLDVPIHRLLDQLSTEEAIRLSRLDAEATAAQPTAASSTSKAKQEEGSTLWTDRYRPKRFTDLLGDDRVHREVMSWVKEWDYCVFGRRQGRGQKRRRDEEGENLDEWKRPKEKILLLSGPPGLGKTTLAHVIARHAGYSVYEINASDARSAQVVEDRLKPALESGSAVDSSRPVLAVIDEIDGATGGSDHSAGFINKLISLTYDRGKKKGRNKSDHKSPRPLLRPIICICNDLYASSLTKLRAYARIVRLSRPNDVQLVRRLRQICENESLKTEGRALAALVGTAQGDLRGCLNALELIKTNGKEVTEPVVRRATVGMKEGEMTPTAVLNDLFLPISRKRAKDLGLTEEDEAKYVARLSREVEGTGAMDRVAEGCFEYYATFHRHDATFARYLKANEWLVSYDVLTGEMWTEREFAQAHYLPFMLVGFYPLFQERGRPRLERPKANWDQHVATTTNQEIYTSLAKCLRSAAARCHGDYRYLATDQVLQLELAPYLNRIISPPLNPVNRQIIRPSEKATLARLVDIMVALELRFIQERMEDGQLVFRLDPPIDVFVTYDGKRASDIAMSKYAVRHLVATEIDAKLAAMHIDPAERSKPKRTEFFKRGGQPTAGSAADQDDEASGRAKRVKQDEGELVEKAAVDFFGRPIITTTPASSAEQVPGKGEAAAKAVQQYRVVYRFKEGNSAAVRKPVKVSSFL